MIYRSSLLVVVAFLVCASLAAEADRQPALSAERIKADVAYLASDRLEGRGPGTRGEFLATEYLAAEFKKAGLKPIGERGTYFQPVPLVRVVTSPKSTLQAVKGDTTLDIPCEEGFSGTSQTQTGTRRVRRRGDLRRPRHHRARVRLGRLQGHGREGQGRRPASPTSRPRTTRNSSAARRSPTTAAGPTSSRRPPGAGRRRASSSTRGRRRAIRTPSSGRSTAPSSSASPASPHWPSPAGSRARRARNSWTCPAARWTAR